MPLKADDGAVKTALVGPGLPQRSSGRYSLGSTLDTMRRSVPLAVSKSVTASNISVRSGAPAVIRYAQRHGTRRPWLVQLLARRKTKIAAVTPNSVGHPPRSVPRTKPSDDVSGTVREDIPALTFGRIETAR
jgi:hypothetical protein